MRNKLFHYLSLCFIAGLSFLAFACSDDDEERDGSSGGVSIKVFSPLAVIPGQTLSITGSHLDEVSSVILPGNLAVDQFTLLNTFEIRLTVPDGIAENGYIALKTKNGNEIESENTLARAHPVVNICTPSTVSPGGTLTLKGEYLEVIESILLPGNIRLDALDFIRKTNDEIRITIPGEAGKGTYSMELTLINGEIIQSPNFTVDIVLTDAEKLLTNNGQGKTWMFALDIPNDNFDGRIWGNGSYKSMPPGPNWWGYNYNDFLNSGWDADAEMYFEYIDKTNFSITVDGVTTTGIFQLNTDEILYNDDGEIWSMGTLNLVDAIIPYGTSPNENDSPIYKYNITTLNEDQLVLSYNTLDENGELTGESWFWRFKRKGFFY